MKIEFTKIIPRGPFRNRGISAAQLAWEIVSVQPMSSQIWLEQLTAWAEVSSAGDYGED